MSNKVSTINIFNKGVKELQKELNTTEYNSWIKPLEFDLQENNFNIYAPNSFVICITNPLDAMVWALQK